MGMMGMFKWLRKDLNNQPKERSHGWNFTSQRVNSLNNDAYRNALQAFIDRRRLTQDPSTLNVSTSTNKLDRKSITPGVPHVDSSDVFEIGSIAGTENRYLELVFAEWQNTRVSLKRSINIEFQDAIESDLKTLLEIRHPNILLLMATTSTEKHNLVTIFEAIDCTLYNYIHEQGEKITIQGIAKSGGRLADALRHCHSRGYIHGALSSHCVYLVSNGTVKLGGWELAIDLNNRREEKTIDRPYKDYLRTEIFRWQAPEILDGAEASKESDVYGLALIIWEMCSTNFPWDGFDKPDIEKHCLQPDRGIFVDLSNYPTILKNLLEAGLQLEPNKRTMDVNRMRRFLQRLEMQYENEEPIYINTNNESSFTRTESIIKSPVIPMKLVQDKQTQKRKSTDRMSIISRLINNNKKIDSLEIIDNVTSISSPAIDTTTEDDISSQNPRTTLTNLKQALAQQRNEFFYGKEKNLIYKIPEINSAWKKEQLICISRMSKDVKGEPTFIFTRNHSPKSDATYLVGSNSPTTTYDIYENELRQNKKNKPTDNTIEDLYIDDEFGDGLNVNMILLHQ